MPELSELGSVIKAAYEAEPDTNDLTDAEQSKLDGIEAGATANPNAIDNIVEDVTPQLGGDLDTNNKAFYETLAAASGNDFTQFKIGRIGTNGVDIASSELEISGKGRIVMASTAITGGTSNKFYTGGFITMSGLTAGATYYLGSNGTLTTTKPTATDSIIRKIGFAYSSTRFELKPSDEYEINSITSTPTDVPAQVTGLAAVAGDAQVTLSWIEPSDNGDPITDYLIEYKASSSGTWLTFSHTASNESSIIVDSLTNDTAYDFRVSAINGIGTGTASSTVSSTPVPTSDPNAVFATGLVAYYDGQVYAGSGDWLNQVANPSDGAAQADYDVTPTNVALWDSNKWVMNNSDFFNGASNPTFINNFHKTVSGNAGTILFDIITPTAAVQTDTLLATGATAGDFGFEIRIDSGGNLKIDQYDGVGVNTTTIASGLLANTRYNIAIAKDYDTDTLYVSVNADTFTTSNPTNWTDAISSSATDAFNIGADGDGTSQIEAATIYGIWFLDKVISNTELANWRAYTNAYYTPPDPTVPGQVTNLLASAGNTVVNLSWEVTDNGGSALTDHLVEYKLTSSGTWLTFSHSANPGTSIQVTGLTNASSYDFRVSAINAVGTGTVSATVSATPIATQTDPYDESPYKLTLPVNSNGDLSGSALEILQPDLLTYESAWFVRGNGVFQFKCPDGGATTATATYSRCEFRHLTNIPDATATQDELLFRVTQIGDGEKTVVHQIHDESAPWVKLVYTGKNNGTGYLRALIKKSAGAADTVVYLLTNITNGDWIKSKIVYTGSALQFYINDVLVHSETITYSGGTYYWKRGNYYQQADRSGDICIVEHGVNANNFISL